jgi:hypothetical protein
MWTGGKGEGNVPEKEQLNGGWQRKGFAVGVLVSISALDFGSWWEWESGKQTNIAVEIAACTDIRYLITLEVLWRRLRRDCDFRRQDVEFDGRSRLLLLRTRTCNR